MVNEIWLIFSRCFAGAWPGSSGGYYPRASRYPQPVDPRTLAGGQGLGHYAQQQQQGHLSMGAPRQRVSSNGRHAAGPGRWPSRRFGGAIEQDQLVYSRPLAQHHRPRSLQYVLRVSHFFAIKNLLFRLHISCLKEFSPRFSLWFGIVRSFIQSIDWLILYIRWFLIGCSWVDWLFELLLSRFVASMYIYAVCCISVTETSTQRRPSSTRSPTSARATDSLTLSCRCRRIARWRSRALVACKCRWLKSAVSRSRIKLVPLFFFLNMRTKMFHNDWWTGTRRITRWMHWFIDFAVHLLSFAQLCDQYIDFLLMLLIDWFSSCHEFWLDFFVLNLID